MRTTRFRPWATAVAVAIALTACSSNRVLNVVSHPPSAQVYVNGELIGPTPVDATIPFDDSPRAFLHLVLPDHEALERMLTPSTCPASGYVEYHLREN